MKNPSYGRKTTIGGIFMFSHCLVQFKALFSHLYVFIISTETSFFVRQVFIACRSMYR